MHSKRGLEMKKKTEIARIALFVVGSIVCAIVAISQVQAMIYDYKTLGWFGLLVDIIFCGILGAQGISRSEKKKQGQSPLLR